MAQRHVLHGNTATAHWSVPVTAAAFLHLEMDVVASWNNVATTFVHKPNLSCTAADHCIHLLKTFVPKQSRKIRATNNVGSGMTQVLVALSVFQCNWYSDLLVNPLRTIADTTDMLRLWKVVRPWMCGHAPVPTGLH